MGSDYVPRWARRNIQREGLKMKSTEKTLYEIIQASLKEAGFSSATPNQIGIIEANVLRFLVDSKEDK